MPDLLRKRLAFFTVIGAAFIAPIVWNFYRPGGGILDVVGYHLGRDFINMWTGPQVVDRFGAMTLLDLKAYHWAQSDIVGFLIHFHNWSYPIDVLFIAYPFSWLPYMPSLAIWTGLGLAIYLVTVGSRIAPEQRLAALLFLIAAPATIVNIVGGQNGFFTASLILGAIALVERRPYVAGVLTGLLTMKPHLGILVAVMLVVLGAWRAIAAAAVTAALLVGASVAVWGIEPWAAYLTRTSAYTWRILVDFEGFQTYMTMSVLASMRAFGLPPPVAETVQAVVSCVVVVTTAVMIRRTEDTALRALLVTAGTFLASPYVFNYDLPILTGAVLWVMTSRPVSERETWVLGAAWVLSAALWTLHLAHIGGAAFVCGATFAVAVAMIHRGQPARAPQAAALPAAAAA